MTFKRTSRIVLVGLAVAAFAGGVTAQQAPGIFERDNEGQIWQTLPSFGQPAGDCEWADIAPGDDNVGHAIFDPNDNYPAYLESLRNLGAPLQCPGGAPIGVDQLFDPRGVAVFDPGPTAGFENSPEIDTARLNAYRVYAADTLNHRIVSWDYFGEDPRTFGGGSDAIAADGTLTITPSDPIAEGQLLFPEGVAVDASGNVLVADQYGGRLSVFTAAEDFWFVKNLPPNGAVRGHRAMPSQIAVVPGVTIQEPAASCAVPGAPAVAVTTWTPWYDASHPATDGEGMSQVLVYDAQFCLVEALGNPADLIDPSWGVDAEFPSPRGSFWMPNQVAFDDSGRLFVADSANYKIEIFDEQLDPLLMICNPDPANGPHADCAEGQPGVIATTDLTGSYGIVVDRRPVVDPVTRVTKPGWQRLVIANHRDQELSVFEVNLEAAEPEAEFAFRLRSEGGLAGFPRAVAQDQVGRYFVVVPGLDKLQMFDIPMLAVFDQTWAPADSGGSTTSVRPNEDFYVTYSIVVPPLKATVMDVEPTLSWTGPAQPVDANSLPLSVPIAEAVTGPLPAVDLQQGQVLTYKFRFKALDSSAADMVFTVGAEGNPVNGVNSTTAATKTVTVPIVCQSCEQNPPVVTADPLGTEYTYNSEPIYGDGRINLIASDPSPGGGSAESSGISRITYRFIGPEEARQPGTHTVLFTPNEANPTAPVDIDGETKVGGGSALISLTESGRHTIIFQAWDGYGNPSGEQLLAFWLDLEPPTVTFEAPADVGTDPNDRRWWKTDVTLTAVKTDTQTPASVTMVAASAPPAGASVASSSATFTAEGMDQRVQVRLTDLVGNTATVFSPVVAIDKTAPQTTASPASGTYVGPLTVTLSGSDPLSGLRNVRYQLSGATCDAPDAPAACSSQVVVSGSSTTLVLTAGGSTTVSYYATDWATNTEAVRTVTYVLNRPPVAADDTLTVTEDTPGTVLLLGNDSDPDDNDLEIVGIVVAPQHGRAEVSGGILTYTPAENFTGTDSLRYQVRDVHGLTAEATVTITVTGDADPPGASHDFVQTPEDVALDVSVLLNDTDPDGGSLTIVSFTQGNSGTVTAGAAGILRYTPSPNFSGEDAFNYVIRNTSGLTAEAAVYVTVSAVDDPPNAVDDTATTDEDTATTIAVTTNDTHPDGDAFTLTGVAAPPAAQGTAVIQGGAILFTPAADFFGTATFSYTITDADGDTDTATVTVTVRPVDDLPTAVNDSATTAEDTAVTIDVLDNDRSPDGTATIVATTPPPTAAGTITVSDDTITFTPAADFNGTASFTYTLADPDDDRATATVTVTVTPVNDPPVAVDDTATTAEDTPINIDVKANDSDPDEDTLTVTAVTQPASGGVVTINSNGTVRLVPAANFSGTVTFTYTISDGTVTRTATVTVTVTPVNDPPTAVNDSYTVVEGQTLVVPAPGVLTNDTDVDDTVLTASRVTSPSRGTLMLLATGGFTYESTLGYIGPVTFTYEAVDDEGLTATATVTITVLTRNTAPVCSAATASPSTLWPPNHRIVDTIAIAGVTDADGDELTIRIKYIWQDEPTNTLGDGDFAIDGFGVGESVAQVRRERQGTRSTPPGDGRIYEIGFEALDTKGGSCTGSVFVGVPHDQGQLATPIDSVCRWDSTVADGPLLNACAGGGSPTNQPPSVSGANQTTQVGTAVSVQVTGSDPEGLALSFAATGLPPGLTMSGAGLITGAPLPAAVGDHVVMVTATDPGGASGSTSFTWIVTAANQLPAGAGDSYEATAGDTLQVAAPGVLGNDTDMDGDDLTAVLVSGPANGTLTLNPDGSFSYVAATGFSGSVTFTYRVRDENEGESEPVTVTITVAAPLTAVDDQYVASAGTVLNVQAPGVLGNDDVPEGQGQVSVAIVSNPGNGSVVLQTNGAFAYTPPANFGGTTTFTYRITRGSQTSNTATVSIRVNRAPTATADTYTVEGNTTLTVSGEGVLDNDSDPDGGMLTAELAQPASSGTVSLNADGSFTYTPASGFVGTATFAYRAVDEDEAESASTTVTITVTAAAPTAVADAYETRINTALTTPAPGVLSNDENTGEGSLTAEVVTTPANGTLTLQANGGFTYTPEDGFTGTDTFTYRALRGTTASAAATVTIEVTATPAAGAKIRRETYFNSTSIVDGTVHIMNAVNIAFNGTATLTGDLLVQGTPTIQINGSVNYQGTIDGGGSASPSNRTITLNSGTTVGHVVRRTDPETWPTIANPPTNYGGTRNVQLNNNGQTPGDFATLRDLTINQSGRQVAVPAGTYRTFIANSGSAFILGVAGATEPAVYNFQTLTLNAGSQIQVVGPVIITVRNQMVPTGNIGSAARPDWLTLRVTNGNLELTNNMSLYGSVLVPTRTVTINGGTQLLGTVLADRLTMNSSGRLTLLP